MPLFLVNALFKFPFVHLSLSICVPTQAISAESRVIIPPLIMYLLRSAPSGKLAFETGPEMYSN